MNRLVVALLPLLCAIQGCTVVLDPSEDQCSTVVDCENRGFSDASCVEQVCVENAVVDPVWGCLGDVTEPVPDPSQRVEFSVKLVFAVDDLPVTTATIDFCDKLDVGCTGTNPDFPKGLTPDAEGVVSVSVVQGFDGFVRITDPEIVDSRIYVGRPIVEPPTVKEVRLLRPSEYAALAAIALNEPDPERGSAILLAVDCQSIAASGVRFESPNADGDSSEFYLINQAPTPPPNATATDADGFGGFFNLAAGVTVARSFREEDGAFIGESSFQILPNTISYVQVSPTPQ